MITIGERVGSYRVVRAIGSGGMGMVFEAVHEYIRSRAAVKILHTQYSQNPEVRGRFLTEALATNLVQHPGIVSIFEHGQLDNGSAYIIMEYLEGASLRARIDATVRAGTAEGGTRGAALPAPAAHPGPPTRKGAAGQAAQAPPLDRAAALRLMRQLASAMAAAHDKGIVHRDLKPENIMIVKDPFTLGGERVKVLDFGIAKVLGPHAERGRTGGLLGTPAYMAPEAWAGAATVDEKVDVYALGIILFEALTGQLPLEDAKANVVRWQELHESAPPRTLRSIDPSIPESLDGLLGRLLSKRPEDRPNMAEVAAELEQLVGLNLRFRAGGFVREGEFYARRAADDQLFYALLNGQSCYVLAPRQSGKTSLVHAVSHRLSSVRGPELERGVLCAVLDLLSVESSGARGERFYFELVRELYRGLGLSGTATDFWMENAARAARPSDRFALLLQDLPAQLGQPAAIFVDHVEVLLRLPLPREEFFAALWSAQVASAARLGAEGKGRERGAAAEPQQLALCVLGTALKEELMPDERHSPFARSRAIALPDLSRREVRTLLPGLSVLGAASEKALESVFEWTAGHPYLTQRLCEALSTKPLVDGSVKYLVDSIAAEVIASNRRREDASFSFAAEGIRRAGELRPAMLALYRQLLEQSSQGPQHGGKDKDEAQRVTPAVFPAGAEGKNARAKQFLELYGFARREGDTLCLRNRIFAAVFSAEWLREEEAVRPIKLLLTQWQTHERHPEYLLGGRRLSEALAWSRGRQDLSSDEQAFLDASVELERRKQRRRVFLLLGAVWFLMASLIGTGLAWRSVRVAKIQLELQQLRTASALREAEHARQEAEKARNKSMFALNAANEARRAADEARIETEMAFNEASRQRGVALSASHRAHAATERAELAARAAQQASQNAQEANRRADEVSQSADRAINEKSEAIAGLQSRLSECDKARRAGEAEKQRCQQSLDSRDAEAQSLRGNIGALNSQLASMNTQLATVSSQLAACRSSEAARPSGNSGAPSVQPESPGGGAAPSEPGFKDSAREAPREPKGG